MASTCWRRGGGKRRWSTTAGSPKEVAPPYHTATAAPSTYGGNPFISSPAGGAATAPKRTSVKDMLGKMGKRFGDGGPQDRDITGNFWQHPSVAASHGAAGALGAGHLRVCHLGLDDRTLQWHGALHPDTRGARDKNASMR